MTHIAGFGRDQLLLLPEAVDDYVEADNSVRFIDAFVDGLDLAGAGFARVEAKATGRPGYAPGDLLKLYIYGYLNRVRSSRRLERQYRGHLPALSHQPFLLLITCFIARLGFNKFNGLGSRQDAAREPLLARCDGVDDARAASAQ